jgi:hypothetical protein
VNKEILAKYHANVTKIVETNICNPYNDNDINDLDDKLYKQISRVNEIEKQIDDFSRALRIACETSFKIRRTPKISYKHKFFPWWTQELTAMRKRTKVLRRKFQRTRHNAELRGMQNKVLRRES